MLDFTKANAPFGKDKSEVMGKEGFSLLAAVSTSGNSSSTFVSMIISEGSVYNEKGGSPSMFLAPAIFASKLLLSGKRCHEHDHSDNVSGKTLGSSRCHCKNRYAMYLATAKFHKLCPHGAMLLSILKAF